MKTFYGLLLLMCLLVISAILLSPILFIWKVLLILGVTVLTWYKLRKFSMQSVYFKRDKILVTENNQVYEANYLASSVVARHLCFLHLEVPGGEKRWWIPVSRLEFSKESFRQLKCALQRFSMQS
ncbi:MAG: hypothetical protein V4496_07110 [Pseudomonadota bacterium]